MLQSPIRFVVEAAGELACLASFLFVLLVVLS